jgi:hypothetical protein
LPVFGVASSMRLIHLLGCILEKKTNLGENRFSLQTPKNRRKQLDMKHSGISFGIIIG